MKENKFIQKKALGQHFLINEDVIKDILASCIDLENKNVLEIGPGNLALTKELVKNAKSVFAIEKDADLDPKLNFYKKQVTNFDYLIGNALEINPLNYTSLNRVLVSNLPYNVGTQIFLDYLFLAHNNKGAFDYFILMFQKEVALRITAKEKTKNYGRLSIISQLLADVHILFDVDKSSFAPPPKVMSSVIYVKPLAEKRFKVNILNLEKTTNLAFNSRRKTIKNSLSTLNINFKALNIDEKKRAEELTLKEFVDIANSIAD